MVPSAGVPENRSVRYGILGSVIYEGRISEELLTVSQKTKQVRLYSPFIERARLVIPFDNILGVGLPDSVSHRYPLCGAFFLFQIGL